MITGSFIIPGGDTEFWVSDLSIKGYQDDPMYNNWDPGQGEYAASFQILDTAGRPSTDKDRYFVYADALTSDDPVEWEGGYWLNVSASATPHGENDYKLKPGDGVWFAGQAFTAGHQQQLIFPTAVK